MTHRSDPHPPEVRAAPGTTRLPDGHGRHSVKVSAPWWAGKWPQRGMYAAVMLVLALGFWAYQSPDIRANWEAIAALCGF